MRAEKRRAGRRIRRQARTFRRVRDALHNLGLVSNEAAERISRAFVQFTEALQRKEQDND